MACGVHVLVLLAGAVLVAAYPRNYFTLLAEPNDPVSTVPFEGKLSREAALSRVTALRTAMAAKDVHAYIVPTADAHNSQYIAPCDARREWLSGLSGSSGTTVVTGTAALVWTDARYFTQFDMEVDTSVWTLMRQGTDATIDSWLATNLPADSAVGVDPTTYTRTAWTALENALSAAGVRLVAVSDNLVDEARRSLDDAPPPRPSEPLITLHRDFSGKASSAKISELIAQINARGASALILTALDDVAYTLNLRGSDIPYNPVFFAYLVIRADLTSNNVILFWGDGQLPANIVEFLASEQTAVDARPYTDIYTYLATLSTDLPTGSTMWLSRDGSHAIYLAAETNSGVKTLSTVSPVALMKCIKNEVELKGFRNAHIKDGTAVVRFLRWVHAQVDAGVAVTEIDVVKKLDELRGEELDYFGPSFSTIAGAGENGAIIHYKPSPEGEQRVITKDDMLLVDSGGQYRDGTTDITRTRHMSSSPTDKQRLAFTRVLQGQILLGTAVFPRGVMGNVLETLARKALWDVGLNYGHGTGHGVGHFLNVHEGPSGILSSPLATDPGISAGMIFSDEPGFYEVGEYGIRHEDLVEVIEINKDADHIYAEGLVGDFDGVGALGFYTISLAPHQTACLDVNLLNDHEIKYINDYHARVLDTLGPILLKRNLTEDYNWLQQECSPIHRSSAEFFTLSPLLLLLSICTLWFRA